METQVQETGMQRFRRLQAEAKELGIKTHGKKTDELEKDIMAKKSKSTEPIETIIEEPAIKVESPVDELSVPVEIGGLDQSELKNIEARLRFEDETREKIKGERQRTIDRAEIIAESESLCIPIEMSEQPTELELAKARHLLGMKKKEVKPSPETIAIEASKRGYYRFTNREQDDASHTVNLGGKYVIQLIPDQIHVLSEFHIKRWRKCAVTPQYQRVATGVVPGPGTVGQAVDKCQRTGDKPRFSFEYNGEAPQDAPFGLVTDIKILEELNKE